MPPSCVRVRPFLDNPGPLIVPDTTGLRCAHLVPDRASIGRYSRSSTAVSALAASPSWFYFFFFCGFLEEAAAGVAAAVLDAFAVAGAAGAGVDACCFDGLGARGFGNNGSSLTTWFANMSPVRLVFNKLVT